MCVRLQSSSCFDIVSSRHFVSSIRLFNMPKSYSLVFQDAAIFELLREFPERFGIAQSIYEELVTTVVDLVPEAQAATAIQCHQAVLLTLAYLQNIPPLWAGSIFRMSPDDCDDLMCRTEDLLKVRKVTNSEFSIHSTRVANSDLHNYSQMQK